MKDSGGKMLAAKSDPKATVEYPKKILKMLPFTRSV
jgi:hypothetical protein